MKIKSFNLTVLLIFLGLSGIVLTQVYWVRNAMKLREEQYHQTIDLHLKTVVNRLLLSTSTELAGQSPICGSARPDDSSRLARILSPGMLDSILYEEFDPLLSRNDYLFGIVRPLTGEVLLASREADTNRLLNANHQVSLSCLFNNDPLYLNFLLCNEKELAYKNVGLWLFLSLLFLLTISGVIIHIMHRWKRQKQLSEIKTDFVNNMTHEFRTPISTISLASEMLLKKDVQENGERVSKYAHIIFNENARLQGQVERILQIAVIDKDDFKIRRKFFDANDVLRGLVRSFAMGIEKRGGVLRTCLGAEETILFADRVHFTNIIANLIDNASKYSPEKPDITLHTSNTDNGLLIMVKDQGIGIARENQEHVFRNLYRVPTGDLHDVKGFGLGLYYVKRMTELHGGYVKVESEFGKGSKFYVFFPFGKESEEEE